jgi:protein-tyrosine phosphatase
MGGDRGGASRRTWRVLVVCAGNICRSPAAAAVLGALGAGHPEVDLEVRSRGTHDWNAGRQAHPAMRRLAAARGYDLSGHVAARVTADDLAWADDVLVMDADNHRHLLARHPDLLGRVRLLDAGGIADPWLVDDDPAYTDALDRIEHAARAYLAGLGAPPGAPQGAAEGWRSAFRGPPAGQAACTQVASTCPTEVRTVETQPFADRDDDNDLPGHERDEERRRMSLDQEPEPTAVEDAGLPPYEQDTRGGEDTGAQPYNG